jgi:MoaA/NifB/PqqE/SkfB family radical SAM enzyme
MEEKFKNLSDVFGNLSKVEENPKSVKKKDETFLMDLLEQLCQIEAVSAVVRTIGIQADKYENPFYISIKMLMQKHYGDMKTEIILWWVFDSLTPEGDVYPLVDEDGKKHILKTPQQLWKFLKKYDGK